MLKTIFLEIKSKGIEGDVFIHTLPCNTVDDAKFLVELAKGVSNPNIRKDDPTLIVEPVRIMFDLFSKFENLSLEFKDHWEKLDHGYEIVDELCDNVLGIDEKILEYRYCNEYVSHSIMLVEHVD